MNWIDWLLVLIILFSVWQGWRSGFLAAITRIAGLIIGLGAAFMGYRPLAEYLDRQWGWGSAVAEFILKKIPAAGLINLQNSESLKEINKIMSYVSKSSNEVITGHNMDNIRLMAYQLAMNILELLSFMVLVLAVSMLVKILLGVFSGVVTHSFLSPLDRFGGLVIGLARGLVIIMVIIIIINPLLSTDVLASSDEAGIWGRAVKNSLLIPYIRQTLDALNIYLPF